MIHRVSFEGAPSPRALQFVGDSAERRAEIGADQREGSYCRDSDQGGNQRVLDGRDPGLAFDQIRKKSAQRNSPPFKKAITLRLRRYLCVMVKEPSTLSYT